MNDRRDKRFVQQSIDIGLSSMQGDPWLAQRVMALEKGESKVKKKTSLTLVLTALIVLTIAAAALAEIAGVNVFELFGRTNARYAQLVPYTALDEVSEVSVTSVELGETTAAINSAYYDGMSLIVGYSIQNGSRVEEFTPDEVLMEKMHRNADDIARPAENEAEAALFVKLERAKAEGYAMGIAFYAVHPGDHTVTDDGIDIAPRSEETKIGDDGVEYTIREFDSPLAEEIQNLDQLTLEIPLYQNASYLYFDGEAFYTYCDVQPISAMKAIVWNSHVPTCVYRGSGEYNGIKLSAVAHASAANAVLEIAFEGALPDVPDLDHWYTFELTDENGAALRENDGANGGEAEMRITYEGTGGLPQELRLTIRMESEGESGSDAESHASDVIILKMQK